MVKKFNMFGNELVPCICGKEARLAICGVGSYVRCVWCGRGTYMCTTREEALSLWEKMTAAETAAKEVNKVTENKQGIEYIKTEYIYPHPENPRKDLGDLTELAESIKKNGVMQNLTVIPGHRLTDEEWQELTKQYREIPSEEVKKQLNGGWKPDGYTLIIGHRRHAAACLAGITELPCKVVSGMSRRNQLSVMLEENMQRNDLTIIEQAQGFQLMLDLGETEDSIAEKTGFSKTTVRHRLNIAKLDQKELKKREQDEYFQLTLKDLYELEKVKDVKIRNKILKEASNSRNLVSRVQSAVAETKRKENEKVITAMLKKLGVKKAPKEVENEQWSRKWKTVKEFELDKSVPKQIKLPKVEGELLYVVWYRDVKVIMKAPKEKRELSPYEKEQKEKDKKKRQIREVLKESSARRKELILNIISGKIDAVKDEEKEMELIWQALIPLGTYIYESTLRRFFLEKDEYKCTDEEKKAAQKKANGLSILHQMLVTLHEAMASTNETFNWGLQFNPAKGDALLKGYEALEPYGWYFEDEAEKKVLDGTHELYVKEVQK